MGRAQSDQLFSFKQQTQPVIFKQSHLRQRERKKRAALPNSGQQRPPVVGQQRVMSGQTLTLTHDLIITIVRITLCITPTMFKPCHGVYKMNLTICYSFN